jgi:hypothetical protein
MISRVKRSLAALALTAGVAVSAFAVASPSQAVSGSCDLRSWRDGTTVGFMCGEGSMGSYRAVATCKNRQVVYGEVVSAPEWSYAYCSSVNSTILSESFEFV